MGVITPLSEQLTKPLPNAMVLVTLKELSSGAHKLLPEGDFYICALALNWLYCINISTHSVLATFF